VAGAVVAVEVAADTAVEVADAADAAEIAGATAAAIAGKRLVRPRGSAPSRHLSAHIARRSAMARWLASA